MSVEDITENGLCGAIRDAFEEKAIPVKNIIGYSSDPVLHHLHGEVHQLLKYILSDFMKMDMVKSCDPFTVPLDDPNLKIPID